MDTLLSIAQTKGVKVDSLQKRLKRNGFPHLFGESEKLPSNIADFLAQSGRNRRRAKERKEVDSKGGRLNIVAKKPLKRQKDSLNKLDWKKVVPVLPLPMLGLAASWGVFHFSNCFVPLPVAVVEAAGFELIYLGLAVSKNLSEKIYRLAVKISLGAVFVSVIYNTISAGLWVLTDGDMTEAKEIVRNLPGFWFWSLAIAHGAPLAVLGYFVADLNFKKSKTQ